MVKLTGQISLPGKVEAQAWARPLRRRRTSSLLWPCSHRERHRLRIRRLTRLGPKAATPLPLLPLPVLLVAATVCLVRLWRARLGQGVEWLPLGVLYRCEGAPMLLLLLLLLLAIRRIRCRGLDDLYGSCMVDDDIAAAAAAATARGGGSGDGGGEGGGSGL
jgi:hypothetical protein